MYIIPVPRVHKLYRLQKKTLLLVHWGSADYTRWSTQSYWQTLMLIGLFLTMLLMIFACIFRPFEHLVRQTVIWSEIVRCYSRSCYASYFRSWGTDMGRRSFWNFWQWTNLCSFSYDRKCVLFNASLWAGSPRAEMRACNNHWGKSVNARGGVAHRETGKFPGGPQGFLAWWAPFAPRILPSGP